MTRITTLLVITLITLTGCKSQGGKVGAGEVTQGERESTRIQLVELEEFADQAATDLIRDLAELPELGAQTRNTPELNGVTPKPTIFIGDLANQTDIVSTRDFEIVARKITSTLLSSRVGREQIKFIERSARVNAIAESEGVTRTPPTLEGGQTYALTGNFYRSARGDTQSYFLEYTLIRLEDGQIVFSTTYDSKRVIDN
ncbi:MAG: hypothetical protein RIG82_09345 [Phycisphaeraceae bacterium]